jgi:hypothetical protein
MTTLVTWIGVDSRGPSSIYMVSDSRITWNSTQKWDCGQKIFTSKHSPDIFGYFGDVFFPSQVLSRIAKMADEGILFNVDENPTSKREKIFDIIRESFINFPVEQKRKFTIVYCTRNNNGMESTFHSSTLTWSPSSGIWSEKTLQIPRKSGIIESFGSGGSSITKWHDRWNNTKEKGTSRIVFSSFCDALNSADDPLSGGAPQLAGLYRIGNGIPYGIIFKNNRFVFGFPVDENNALNNIEWRNSIFERCSWETKKRLEKAQKHILPNGLGKAF